MIYIGFKPLKLTSEAPLWLTMKRTLNFPFQFVMEFLS